MKKQNWAFIAILTVLISFESGMVKAQSIQGVNPALIRTDQQVTGNDTIYHFAQVQPTIVYNASPTPSPVYPQPTQVSNWIPNNGKQAILIEFAANTLAAYYGVQVSNNPTPYPSQTPQYYTPVRDHGTWSSGGAGAQSLNWDYLIGGGWSYYRVFCAPETANGGYLDVQAKTYTNGSQGPYFLNTHTYQEGVPWKNAQDLENSYVQSGAGGVTLEYKMPYGSKGVYIYSDTLGVSGASTLTTTLFTKDPVSGLMQAVAVGTATHAAGFTSMFVGPGAYQEPYPVATPPSGQNIISVPIGQDLVVGDVWTGTGSTTLTQSIGPLSN